MSRATNDCIEEIGLWGTRRRCDYHPLPVRRGSPLHSTALAAPRGQGGLCQFLPSHPKGAVHVATVKFVNFVGFAGGIWPARPGDEGLHGAIDRQQLPHVGQSTYSGLRRRRVRCPCVRAARENGSPAGRARLVAKSARLTGFGWRRTPTVPLVGPTSLQRCTTRRSHALNPKDFG